MTRPDRSERTSAARTTFAWCSTILLLLAVKGFAASPSDDHSSDAPPPSTPRESFNAGTHKLQEGKLREAEALLESALGSQNESLEPPALYNLGHVRFGEGVEELKKGPSSAKTMSRGRDAMQHADKALASIDQAMADAEIKNMVSSYLEGRGARRELKAAIAAVKRALETYGTALRKWQRSSGDFKGALELNSTDADARANAETVDQNIAKLIDSIREMNAQSDGMCQKANELGDKLKKLKGKIPGEDMPQGAGGEDEDEEEQPQGMQPGQQEGASKDGQEMLLTPEQAGWLLEGFKLDSERRLPMAEEREGKPSDRKRRPW